MSATLPITITNKLAGLRAHLRRIAFLHGLARVAVAAVGFVLGTYVLDRLLDLPAAFRLVLLLAGVGGIGWAAWRFLLQPLSHASDDDAIALRVEREYPELKDELISAVQLSRLPDDRQSFHSTALVRRVIEGAEERARLIDFGRVVDTSHLRRFGLLAVAVTGIMLALAASQPRDARIWFERMILLGDTPWPRTVELAISISDRVVARGDDVVITAEVKAGAPSRVVIEPTFEKTGRGEEIAMVQIHNTFRSVIENVNEPFSFVVEGGDYRSQRFTIDVRQRPKVEDLSVTVEYPKYTGLATPPEPQKDGNLKVPAGTRVRFEARSSEPLREAEVTFTPPGAVEIAKPAALGSDGKVAGEFVVRDSSAWAFRLVSKEGFESPTAAQYTIRAIPDRLPDVSVPRPGRNKDVTRGASVLLKVEVRDDYEPLAATLVFQIAKGGAIAAPGAAAAAVPEQRIALSGLPGEKAAKQATLAYSFDLAPLGLEPNDRVTYWVEAVDNRAPKPDTTSVPVESRGKSEKYQLRVVSDDELLRMLQGRLKRLRDDLGQAAKSQKSTRDDLESLGTELAGRTAPDARDRRRLTYAELDQRKIGQRLERAKDEFADVADEMASNKVGKPDDLQWLAELGALTDDLARDKAARASGGLQAIRQAEKVDAPKLGEVVVLQGQIYDGLQDLIRRLDKWDEYNEVLRDLRDLLRMQETVKQATEERAKADLNQDQKR